ncbi:MAG: CsgG/HfaB family protein [Acidobacteriota bacterium]
MARQPHPVCRTFQLVLVVVLGLLSLSAGADTTEPYSESNAEADDLAVIGQVLVDDWALGVGETTDRLQVLRAGAFEAEDAAPSMTLAVGDSLLVPDLDERGIQARVACSDETEVRLDEAFEVVVLPPGGSLDCNLLVLRGAVDLQTDAPTRLQSGETVMGSRATQYGVRLIPTRRGQVQEVLVFEGEIVLHAAGEETLELPAGQKVVVTSRLSDGPGGGTTRPTDWTRVALDGDDVQRVANVYARLDTATLLEAEGDGPEAGRLDVGTVGMLEELYAQTLMRPDDPKARLALASAQLDVGLPAWTATYQLDRAVDGYATRGQSPELVQALTLRAAAADRQGDTATARRDLRRAISLEPQLVARPQTLAVFDPTRVEVLARAPTLAVLEFDAQHANRRYWRNRSSQLQEDLQTELLATGRFRLADSDRFEEAQREMALSGTPWIDPRTASELGELLGVDFILVGRIEEYDVIQRSGSGVLSKSVANASVAVRVIDTATGRVVWADRAAATKTPPRGIYSNGSQSEALYDVLMQPIVAELAADLAGQDDL